MISETDASWAAGFIEGEGSVRISDPRSAVKSAVREGGLKHMGSKGRGL